jgi:hypothetical protein
VNFASAVTSGSKISEQSNIETAGGWSEIDKTPNAE